MPTQLIPYHQYTVNAVIGALLLVLECSQKGQKGFYGASVAVDPDSLVTPWLMACWLAGVVLGLRRAHGILRQWYPLADIRSSPRSSTCKEVAAYFLSLGWHLRIRWGPSLQSLANRYSRSTGQFFFGTPSQSRTRRRIPVQR